MNSDAIQEKAVVDASTLLNEMKSFKEELAELSLKLDMFNSSGNVLDVLPTSEFESFKKCLDDADLILTKADLILTKAEAVIEQGEGKQVIAVMETFADLRSTLELFLHRYGYCLDRQRKILRGARFFLIFVAVEVVLWVSLYGGGVSNDAPWFVLFTIMLIPQVVFGYIVLLWEIGKRIVASYKGRHI